MTYGKSNHLEQAEPLQEGDYKELRGFERGRLVRSIEHVKNKRAMTETTSLAAFPCVFSFSLLVLS
jgi:hypothetical protein